MRRPILLLLKVAISAALLYLSLRSVNLGVLSDRLTQFNFGWIVLALIILATQIGLLALRWREIAALCGAPLKAGQAVQVSWIATFFNQVLPSTIGGDATRIWLLGRQSGSWANATYSVLIDRIVGLLVLALIVLACLPWTLALIHEPLARAALLLIGGGAIAGALVFLALGLWPPRLLNRWTLARHLIETARMTLRLCCSGRIGSRVFVYSVAIHGLTIAAAWCCMKAVAAPIGFIPILFLMPPVLLISTIPISIAGWGVRESSMVVAFAYAGLSQGDGLTLSILFGAATLAVGILGGIVWIASGMKKMRMSPEPQLTEALDR